MKTVVVIPTYDERENVARMSEAVLACGVEVLFVDDNSPDGTGDVLDSLAAHSPRVHVLHRVRKEGLGRAYVAGFAKALELGANMLHIVTDDGCVRLNFFAYDGGICTDVFIALPRDVQPGEVLTQDSPAALAHPGCGLVLFAKSYIS